MTDQKLFTDFEMVECSIDLIDEGDRVRGDYGNLHELKKSLKENSLGQPIIVAKHPDKDSEKEYILVAGGRRFRAISMLSAESGRKVVPCRVLQSNDEYTRALWEDIENAQRKDFTWYEQAEATARAHKAFQKLYGSSSHHAMAGHTQKDTADRLRMSPATVSTQLKTAQMLESMPEPVRQEIQAKAKNHHQAVTMMKSVAQQAAKAAEAKQVQEEWSTKDTLSGLLNSYVVCERHPDKPLYEQGFFEKAAETASGVYDLIEIDPPYAIALKENKKNPGANIQEYNEVPVNHYNEFLDKLLTECVRLARSEGSWIILWHGIQWYETIHQTVLRIREKNPIVFWTTLPAYWNKTGAAGQTKDINKRLGSVIEQFAYIRIGNAKIYTPGRANVYNYAPVPSAKKRHPTERPLELMKDVIKTFTKPGGNMLVPFAGSGVSLEAAYEANMECIGYDLSEEYRAAYILDVKQRYGKDA